MAYLALGVQGFQPRRRQLVQLPHSHVYCPLHHVQTLRQSAPPAADPSPGPSGEALGARGRLCAWRAMYPCLPLPPAAKAVQAGRFPHLCWLLAPALTAAPALCRPQLGRSVTDYIGAANDEVTLLVQVETRQCYEDLEVGAALILLTGG